MFLVFWVFLNNQDQRHNPHPPTRPLLQVALRSITQVFILDRLIRVRTFCQRDIAISTKTEGGERGNYYQKRCNACNVASI